MTMNLSPLPIQKFFSSNGRPLDGGLLFTYAAGTADKIATYTDSTGGASNTNPIELNFRGECRLWIDPALAYKFILSPKGDTDPPTNPIWTVDNITAGPAQQDNAATDTGSVNNIVLSIPQISSPVAFTRIVFKAANRNTGPTTISINGGPAADLTWQNSDEFIGGELQPNGIYEAVYDGARWQWQGPLLEQLPRTAVQFGASGGGSVDDSDELSNASAQAAGKIILLPKGTYLITDTWTLSAGTTYEGEGPESIIKMQSDQLAATDLAGITFKNLKVTANVTGFTLLFTRCDNLQFENVYFDNTVSGTNQSGTTAIRVFACDNVRVDGCTFINCYYGVYAGDDGLGEKCGTVYVTRSHFEHTILSQGDFPAQVYQFQCDHMYVDMCSFRNIYPASGASNFGYSVYQGDGVGITTSVQNCWGVASSDHGSTAQTVFVQAANTVTWLVENCYFNGGGLSAKFADGSARTLTQFIGNTVLQSFMVLQPGDGATLCDAVVIERNYFRLSSQGLAAMRVGANGNGFNYLNASDNNINGSTNGGLFVNDVRKYAHVVGNNIVDVNIANNAFTPGVNEFEVSCISFFGATARLGIVAENYCENTWNGTGNADFGFACDSSTHSIDVRPDNRFIRMDTATARNMINAATNPWPWQPPGGNFWFGDPTTGNPPGRVCTHNFQTTIRNTEAAGQTVIDVVSNTGMLQDDFVAILLDTGAYHYSFLAAAPGAGPVITINNALPSQAAAGNEVVVARYKAMANLA